MAKRFRWSFSFHSIPLSHHNFPIAAPGEKAPPRKSSRVKLYIGNLSFYTIPDTLIDAFSEFGTVHDCYLPEDPATGASRGFGFVTMDKESALQAVAELDGCEIDGRKVRVNQAQPKGEASGGKRSYRDSDPDVP
jgi:cold-inducible RNA-binding protein